MAIYTDQEQDGNVTMWHKQNTFENCTKKVRFYNINFDTDNQEIYDLPTELILEVDNDFYIPFEGADLISDETGFRVNSFNVEIL